MDEGTIEWPAIGSMGVPSMVINSS